MNYGLTINIRRCGNTIIIDLKGVLIGSKALDLKEKLLEIYNEGIQNLVLNFRDVTSIDTLGVLVIAEALSTGLRIKALHLPSICREMFDKHGLPIESYHSLNNAIREFMGGPVEFPERRCFPRKETRIPVEFTIYSGLYRGVILNISVGGVLLGYCDPLLEEDLLGRDITLNIETPPEPRITLLGAPIGCREHHLLPAIGVRLIHTPKSLTAMKRLWGGAHPAG